VLKLFNTLSRHKEEFKPLDDVVGIYTCGPSVYQYAHLGNFRTFIFEDVLVRYLRWKGFRVKRVMNLTDIEDKTIATAHQEGKTLRELTGYYSKICFEDMEKLNLLPSDVFPRATEHKLKPGKKKIKRDEWGEDSAIISDFALWKSYEKEDGNVFRETELGKGRSGWHIECSAMCTKHLRTRIEPIQTLLICISRFFGCNCISSVLSLASSIIPASLPL
jgi:cysteinyl-tRNA synthetase